MTLYQIARIFARNRMHWKFRVRLKSTDAALASYRKGRLSSINILWDDIKEAHNEHL